MGEVSYLLAFGAGLLSFVSPCCLPLIPAYVSYITGASVEDLEDRRISLRRIMGNSLLFVSGFSLIFVAMGATSTYIGKFLISNLTLLRMVAGVVIIFFGLHYAGLLKLKFLYTEKRWEVRRAGMFSPLLVGITFAAGWTPCIGPILGSILALAATFETMTEGILLLSFYSAGFAIPFLATSAGISQFSARFDVMRRHTGAIQTATGFLLILVGFLMLTNLFARLSGLLVWSGIV